jgi:hypothetical protein
MYARFFLAASLFAASGVAVRAQTTQRRADFTGDRNNSEGKCTIEIVVDGAADVEVRGDTAWLHNLNGRAPEWRRFQCNAPLPPNPVGFRFKGIDGRGSQRLIQDPARGGVAVVRIEDPENGAEGYTFDLIWKNTGGNYTGVYPPYPESESVDRDRERDREFDRSAQWYNSDDAIRDCESAVRRRMFDQTGSDNIDFRRIEFDADARSSITGVVVSRDRNVHPGRYRFACSVDYDRRYVRGVDLDPERR